MYKLINVARGGGKKQTKKVNDFRLWKQSHNLKNENIIVKANGNQSTEEIKKCQFGTLTTIL